MESYKEKYEQALNDLMEIKKANKDNKKLVDFIEYKYPELKDRRDEKIKNMICGWICTQPSSFFDDGFSKEEVLAWLEKQVEQKSIWSKEDEKFFKIALWHISNSVSNGKSTDIHCDTTDWLKSLKNKLI